MRTRARVHELKYRRELIGGSNGYRSEAENAVIRKNMNDYYTIANMTRDLRLYGQLVD